MATPLRNKSFIESTPKRTRIGDGRRVRTIKNAGRTKRSSPKKTYRGQGKS